MIHFVNEVPESPEESNIYIVKNGENADLYASDQSGTLISISTQALALAHVTANANTANNPVILGSNGKIGLTQMPSEFKTSSQITSEINTQVNALVSTAPGALDTLDELAAALGDDANFASTVTTALAGKQAALSNAAQVAKIGEGTFDGKPIALVNTVEW